MGNSTNHLLLKLNCAIDCKNKLFFYFYNFKEIIEML